MYEIFSEVPPPRTKILAPLLVQLQGNQTNNRSKRIAAKGSQLIVSCDKKAYSKQHVMLL